MAAAIPPSMARTYPVLARIQGPADVPPPGAIAVALNRGATLTDARRAAVTSRGESLYVVAAGASVCIGSSDLTINGCSPFPLLTPNQIVGETAVCATHDDVEFAALLPGRPSAVTVHYRDGSTRPLQVENGVVAIYARRTEPLPVGISWRDAAGRMLRADMGMPSDAASTRC